MKLFMLVLLSKRPLWQHSRKIGLALCLMLISKLAMSQEADEPAHLTSFADVRCDTVGSTSTTLVTGDVIELIDISFYECGTPDGFRFKILQKEPNLTTVRDLHVILHGHGGTLYDDYSNLLAEYRVAENSDLVILVEGSYHEENLLMEDGNFFPLYGNSWNIEIDPLAPQFKFSSTARDDIQILEELVDFMRSYYVIENAHIAGFSTGGAMVFRLACNSLSSNYNSFSSFNGFDSTWNFDEEQCDYDPDRKLFMLFTELDYIVPEAGGYLTLPYEPAIIDVIGAVLSSNQTFSRWTLLSTLLESDDDNEDDEGITELTSDIGNLMLSNGSNIIKAAFNQQSAQTHVVEPLLLHPLHHLITLHFKELRYQY